MARWAAIVALLLGVGFTAFQSFSDPMLADRPVTQQAMEGGTGFPTPPPWLAEGGTGFPTPPPW